MRHALFPFVAAIPTETRNQVLVVIVGLIGLVVLWLVIHTAVLAALREHERKRNRKP